LKVYFKAAYLLHEYEFIIVSIIILKCDFSSLSPLIINQRNDEALFMAISLYRLKTLMMFAITNPVLIVAHLGKKL
jgi:hypothetical protein